MENGRRSDFHSATKVELNVASQDLSAQEIIAAFSDGAVKLMMDTIPIRYGPRFSRLFAEHIRSLEARHGAEREPGGCGGQSAHRGAALHGSFLSGRLF